MPGDPASETGRQVEERSGDGWLDPGVRGQAGGAEDSR